MRGLRGVAWRVIWRVRWGLLGLRQRKNAVGGGVQPFAEVSNGFPFPVKHFLKHGDFHLQNFLVS